MIRLSSYQNSLTKEQQVKAKLTQALTLTLLVVATPFYFIFNYAAPRLGMSILIIVTFYLISLLCNYFGRLNISRGVFLVNTILGTFYYSHVTPHNAGVHLVFFACLGYPFIIFDKNEKWLRYIFVAIPFGFLMLHTKDKSFLQEITMAPQYESFIYGFALFFVGLKISLSFYYFVTEITKSQNQLALKNQDLEKALIKLKQSRDSQLVLSQHADYARLVQSIAHEFKNPLQMLQGTAEIGLLRDQSNKEVFSTIISSVERLNNVIQPMLTYLNTNNNYEFQPFELIETVKDILLLSKANCKAKGIELELINQAQTHTTYGDSTAIGQVFINLITNAIDAIGSDGHIKINVFNDAFLSNHQVVDGICIQVKDTGSGIAKDQIKFVFSPYESSKKDANNVGLGLTIVSKIIKEHAGLISIDSKLNYGTTVTVWLPTSGDTVSKTKQSDFFEINSEDFEN
ncbi:MAG: sensor histidine kinase [Candidatus Marinamargulisbacteria bacterium]